MTEREVEAAARAHEWFERFGLTCCKACGLVRRRDGSSNPCRGPVKVALREARAALLAAEQVRE